MGPGTQCAGLNGFVKLASDSVILHVVVFCRAYGAVCRLRSTSDRYIKMGEAGRGVTRDRHKGFHRCLFRLMRFTRRPSQDQQQPRAGPHLEPEIVSFDVAQRRRLVDLRRSIVVFGSRSGHRLHNGRLVAGLRPLCSAHSFGAGPLFGAGLRPRRNARPPGLLVMSPSLNSAPIMSAIPISVPMRTVPISIPILSTKGAAHRRAQGNALGTGLQANHKALKGRTTIDTSSPILAARNPRSPLQGSGNGVDGPRDPGRCPGLR